jgi:hypothetical protein
MAAMTIVTAKPPRKRRQEPQNAAIAGPVIVTARKLGKRLNASLEQAEPDPETEARVAAFFARAIRPPGE